MMSTAGMVLLILGIYGAVMVAIAVRSRGKSESFHDSITAQGQTGVLMIIGSVIGMEIGSGFVVGGAEYGAIYGIGGAWYGIGCGLSPIIVGLFLTRFIYRNNYVSPTDFFAKRYESDFFSLLYTVVSLVCVVSILAGQLLAGRAVFMTIGVPGDWAVVLTAAISLVYTAVSGLWGTMAASTIQSAIILFGMLAASFTMLLTHGITPLMEQLPAQYFDMAPFDAEKLVSMLVPVTLLSLIGQANYQRILSARSERVSIVSQILSGIVVLSVAMLPPLLGMFGRTLFPEAEPSTVFMELLLTRLPVVVGAIILAAIVCAVMGSCNSTFIMVGAVVVRNIYLHMINPAASDRTCKRLMWAVNGIFCALGVFVALRMNDIIGVMSTGYTLMSSGFVVPLVLGALWKGGTTRGAAASSVGGILLAVLDTLGVVQLPFVSITTVVVGAAIFVVVSLLDKKGRQQAAQKLAAGGQAM